MKVRGEMLVLREHLVQLEPQEQRGLEENRESLVWMGEQGPRVYLVPVVLEALLDVLASLVAMALQVCPGSLVLQEVLEGMAGLAGQDAAEALENQEMMETREHLEMR